jgi:RHS repeat-associated protein
VTVLALSEAELPEELVLENEPPRAVAANDERYPYDRRCVTEHASGLTLYEKYHPFGTTSYRAANSAIEVSATRYRYIGKERDEETGLYHCGARYYASWLGRWTSADSCLRRTDRRASARPSAPPSLRSCSAMVLTISSDPADASASRARISASGRSGATCMTSFTSCRYDSKESRRTLKRLH